ncbi:MAG: metallophosphoesterase [Candidatus Hydrogenedentes bacterium]|nr:metallophosphoesterase [Candidatus Hydrogenedentota bacterium]
MRLNSILNIWIVFTTFLFCNLTSRSAIVDISFEKLKDKSPAGIEYFDFVVFGDNRPSEPGEIPEVFLNMIEEWNILRPSLIIGVGDFILGGSVNLLNSQWDEFESLVKRIESPFLPVPGNHDISDSVSEELYKSRVGPTCYAFSYGNSRFIILNTEEPGQVDSLSDQQVEWLKSELERFKAKHIFVFLHKPYFYTNTEKWKAIEDLLIKFPSVYVFGGHDHRYLFCGKNEGISYIITAGGGAEIRREEEEGGFYHYLLVKVVGDEVSWSVIRPGSIHPRNIVDNEKLEFRNAWRKVFTLPLIECKWGSDIKANILINITNPFGEEAKIKTSWVVPRNWEISNTIPESFTIQGNSWVSYNLVMANQSHTNFEIYPVPELRVNIEVGEKNTSFTTSPVVSPVISIPELPGGVIVDGDFSEWGDVPYYPLLYSVNFDVTQNTQDLQANWRGAWSKEGIYMAVDVVDNEFYQPYAGDIVWCADNLEIFLGEWEWSVTLTSSGPEVFMYEGPNREEEVVNNTVKLAVVVKGGHIYYEIWFPSTEVAPLNLVKGERITFSIIANDLDSQGPVKRRHWLEFTPGAGSGKEDFPLSVLILE